MKYLTIHFNSSEIHQTFKANPNFDSFINAQFLHIATLNPRSRAGPIIHVYFNDVSENSMPKFMRPYSSLETDEWDAFRLLGYRV